MSVKSTVVRMRSTSTTGRSPVRNSATSIATTRLRSRVPAGKLDEVRSVDVIGQITTMCDRNETVLASMNHQGWSLNQGSAWRTSKLRSM